jgi:hypothetical protein
VRSIATFETDGELGYRYDVIPELSNEELVKAGVDAAKSWLAGRLSKAGNEALYAVNTGVGERGTFFLCFFTQTSLTN